MLSYAHTCTGIFNEKAKILKNSLENMTWSEMGKQSVQAKEVNVWVKH